MSWLSNLVGDVTKGVEEVVPGARNLDRFLNKAGIGPADAFQNPFKPQGWAGDIEHGLSQASHSPAGRALEEAAAIAAMAYFAPELIGTMSGDFSAADMEAIAQAGAESGGAAAGGSAATSYGADIAAETATAGDVGSAASGATASGAATAPGGMPELVAQASRLPQLDLSGLPYLVPMIPGAMAGVPNPQARTAQAKSYGTDQNVAPSAPAALAPGTVSGLLNPMDVQIADPTAAMAGSFLPEGGFVPPDAGTDIALENAMDVNIADPTASGPGWQQSLLNYLKSPKGMLTAGMLGMSGLNALRTPKLPASAQQAANIASQNAAQAQVVITSGGQGTPLWGQQKAAIDASIDEQIQNATAAIQQTMQNTSGQGGNSAAVQAQIADVTGQLEAQRQILYQQALQQNVTNALNELSGADSTLMAVGQLQYQESIDAKQLAAQLAEMAGWLNVNWSGGTGGIKQPTQPTVPTGMPGG